MKFSLMMQSRNLQIFLRLNADLKWAVSTFFLFVTNKQWALSIRAKINNDRQEGNFQMKLFPIFASEVLGRMMHSNSSPCENVEYFLGSKVNFIYEPSKK